MTNNTLPPKNCICASFYTVRGKHKPDCPLYRNTLDKILAKYITRETHKGSVNRIRHLAREELADREKEMLEFILPKKINQEKILKAAKSWFKDKQRNAYMAMGVNSTIRHVRQRAKEWEGRNG